MLGPLPCGRCLKPACGEVGVVEPPTGGEHACRPAGGDGTGAKKGGTERLKLRRAAFAVEKTNSTLLLQLQYLVMDDASGRRRNFRSEAVGRQS